MAQARCRGAVGWCRGANAFNIGSVNIITGENQFNLDALHEWYYGNYVSQYQRNAIQDYWLQKAAPAGGYGKIIFGNRMLTKYYYCISKNCIGPNAYGYDNDAWAKQAYTNISVLNLIISSSD